MGKMTSVAKTPASAKAATGRAVQSVVVPLAVAPVGVMPQVAVLVTGAEADQHPVVARRIVVVDGPVWTSALTVCV